MWIVTDKWGNRIELTEERWTHIIESHWELSYRSLDRANREKETVSNRSTQIYVLQGFQRSASQLHSDRRDREAYSQQFYHHGISNKEEDIT